jgi:arabinofuranan 3-O-arabinosyltransferase
VDGDVRTTWTADAADPDPSLTLRWDRPQVVDSLTVRTSPVSASSVPDSVTVRAGWITQSVRLDAGGVARFAAVTTDELTVSFPVVTPMSSYDPYRVATTPLGVGVTELSVPGAVVLDTAAVVEVPCGLGPVVDIDGRAHETRVTATVADLRALRPVPVQACGAGLGTGRLDAGEHRFAALSTGAFAVDSATLSRVGAARPASGRTAADVVRWDAEHRVVALPARDRPTLLVVPENQNAGWRAVLDGRQLATRTVDGWQQV